jgi:hypothetical protein
MAPPFGLKRAKIASRELVLGVCKRKRLKIVIPREGGVSSTPRLLGSISGVSGTLDHPLEPVIGRRGAPTRWRMMTVGKRGEPFPHALSA